LLYFIYVTFSSFLENICGMFNMWGSPSCNICVNQAFCFSVGVSISKGKDSVQQMVKQLLSDMLRCSNGEVLVSDCEC
jgi:hypothetical protein